MLPYLGQADACAANACALLQLRTVLPSRLVVVVAAAVYSCLTASTTSVAVDRPVSTLASACSDHTCSAADM
jgi:hypothetical protein